MMQSSTIKDLNVISGIEGLAYYCNAEMLDDNVFIKAITFQDEEGLQTWIEVFHKNKTKIDNMIFTIYNDTILSPIQERAIIKDIYELYKDNPLGDFIEMLHELSEQFQSSSMQSDDDNKHIVQENVEMEFKRLLHLADSSF